VDREAYSADERGLALRQGDAAQNPLGGAFEHALPAHVVGLVEALEECLRVTMARDGDAHDLARAARGR
jgi:hypothetical protein